jgi:rubrerythrin
MSQFMHGEQGALVCTAKIVETVPWIDAKYYAATQVMDEARHVEVFAKYLDTKLNGHYPLNAHLGLLLDDIINDSRWDMTYLGMQIMVEGLALAAFGLMHMTTPEPLLKQMLRYVMSDEARHVAFGVLSLKEYYGELTDAELKDRQEFAFEAAVRMRDRLLMQEVLERMDVDVKAAVKIAIEDEGRKMFQQLLFSKIVPNCKKLGLLEANDQWLRHRFEELGVIQFEDLTDTSDEYEAFALDADGNAPEPEAATA